MPARALNAPTRPIWNIRRAYVTLCEAAFAGVVASMSPEQKALLDPGLIETACRGMMTSAAIGWQAELERVRLIQAFAAFFNHYDLLLTPCVPIAPFTAGHGINTPDASAYPEWYDWTPYTWVFNAAKLPAASCPWGLNAAGLPQAVQLAATHFREDLVLRASAILEADDAGPASKRCAVAVAGAFPGIPRLICGRSQNDSRMCQIAPSQAAEARCSST